MKRGLVLLAVLFLCCGNAVYGQKKMRAEDRYPLRPEFEYNPKQFYPAPNVIAQTDETALQDGGEWLLTQQFADGSYPWTVGEGSFSDSQGATARGMLTAYYVMRDADHLASAIRSGDYLVDFYPRRFSDGDPDIFPLDPLFLEELTLITGNNKYANFVQTFLWDKLKAGTYGENNDLDAAEWADAVPVFEEFDFWVAMEPVYRSTVAIAAHYTNELAIRDALLNSIVDKLEATALEHKDGDLTGLAGAILASAHTGFNLNPQSGRWASANSTQDLVNILVSYQRSGGAWPYDTSKRALNYVGDVSVTSWACKALKAWNAQTYASNIASALSFIKSLQQSDGQILTNPGYGPETHVGVEIHAEALIAIGADDGVLLNNSNNPNNQAPIAHEGNAITNEDTPTAVTLQATDADNDLLTYSLVTNPSKGTLSGTAPNLTYTPNANANGSDSFTFLANDGYVNSNTATFSLTINAVNDTPVANNQNVTTTANTAIAITLTANDVDNTTLTYSIVTPPSNGTLSGTPPAMTYTPNANYTGSDNFTFKANDGQYNSNIATVAITVSAANSNLALNKPVTASSTNSSYPTSRAVDGNTSTHWRSGSVSSSTLTWLRVDLQSVQTISRVVVEWNSSYYAKNYQIQISQDNLNWSTIYTDNSGNGGDDNCVFATTTARYVRVYMTKNNKSTERIKEFEVYAGAGSLARPVTETSPETATVASLTLQQNHPNPFNPATTIRFSLSHGQHVELKIVNALGQQVALLLNDTRMPGEHAVRFDATGLPSGLYFAVLQAGAERRVSRLQLLK